MTRSGTLAFFLVWLMLSNSVENCSFVVEYWFFALLNLYVNEINALICIQYIYLRPFHCRYLVVLSWQKGDPSSTSIPWRRKLRFISYHRNSKRSTCPDFYLVNWRTLTSRRADSGEYYIGMAG